MDNRLEAAVRETIAVVDEVQKCIKADTFCRTPERFAEDVTSVAESIFCLLDDLFKKKE